jgi:hypothetical protein
MKHSTYSCKISYVGDNVGERGREQVLVTKHADGSRSMQAHCEIFDSQILRQVTLSVDPNWYPLDASVRLSIGDEFIGSGWYWFGDVSAECEAFSVENGRVSQRLPVAGRVPFFIAHPVASDLWLLGAFDRNGDNLQTISGGMMCSPLSDGASTPLLHQMDLSIEYLGKETVTVPAGTFETDHFCFLIKDKPSEHLWCYGEDLILVKIRWDLLNTSYELVEFTSFGFGC